MRFPLLHVPCSTSRAMAVSRPFRRRLGFRGDGICRRFRRLVPPVRQSHHGAWAVGPPDEPEEIVEDDALKRRVPRHAEGMAVGHADARRARHPYPLSDHLNEAVAKPATASTFCMSATVLLHRALPGRAWGRA